MTAKKPSKPSELDPVGNSCRDANNDSINAHDRTLHLSIGEDNRSPDQDVDAETPSIPSPILNAIYDSSRILAIVATPPGTSGIMSSPSSNSIAAQSEVPRRDSNVPELFDFIVSPSPFGTDESLPHLPAMVAAHALTPSDDCTNARGRASTNLMDQKSEIIETDPELSFFLRQFADTMGNW